MLLNFPFNPFSPDSANSQIDKFSKNTNWEKSKTKQHHSKVLLNSFPMNGHTLEFCSQTPEVSLWESKGFFYSIYGWVRVRVDWALP